MTNEFFPPLLRPPYLTFTDSSHISPVDDVAKDGRHSVFVGVGTASSDVLYADSLYSLLLPPRFYLYFFLLFLDFSLHSVWQHIWSMLPNHYYAAQRQNSPKCWLKPKNKCYILCSYSYKSMSLKYVLFTFIVKNRSIKVYFTSYHPDVEYRKLIIFKVLNYAIKINLF